MKFHHLLFGAVVFLTACSSPKYTYNFDQYDYSIGKRSVNEASEVSPLTIHHDSPVSASTTAPVARVEQRVVGSTKRTNQSAEALVVKYQSMSSSEKKAFRKELKKELKNYSRTAPSKVEGVESVKRTKAFDTFSGLAILFGGAGIVMIMLAAVSNVFWVLGAIAFVIGAFFFVKWVSNGNG